MRKALLVCGFAVTIPFFLGAGGCNSSGVGTGGSGGSGGTTSGPSGPNGSTGNGATSGKGSTGNGSTGNGSTGNASTGNATSAVTSAVGTTGGVTTGGGDMEPANMTGMTAAHNAARAAVNPPANPAIPNLVWSSTVATYAQNWANNCMFQHSMGQYGENIFATTGSATPQEVVTDWVSEAADYNYANNTCSNVCGHYTQVVWRDTTSLGCGVTNCTTNSPFGSGNWQLWVCDYDPPGNFNNMKPY